jgi:NAD(P)-dependent dehydrogenase (short-subunit alcohol dehydrogenase family)
VNDDGRAALVTGASSGIGLALSRALTERGYRVTLVGRRRQKLLEAAATLEGELNPYAADLGDGEQIEAVVRSHQRRFGRLDLLVNNAGVGIARPLAETTPKLVDLALSVNLRAALLCTRAATPMLLASAPANVINVASITGLKGEANMTAYSASKAGLIGFTEALQAELGPRGIRATAICPAFVDTEMADAVREVVPRHELIQVEDVVAMTMAVIGLSAFCTVPTIALEPLSGSLQGWAKIVAEERGSG